MKKHKIQLALILFSILTTAGLFCLAASAAAGPSSTVSTPYAWVVNSGGNSVSQVDTSSNTVLSTPGVGTQPHGVAVDDSGYVWVTNIAASSVSKIEVSTHSVVDTIAVGRYPEGIAIDASGYVWVVNSVDHNLNKIDPSTDTVVSTINGFDMPMGIAVDAGGYLWVVDLGTRTVEKVDIATENVVGSVSVGQTPEGVAVDNSGYVWVTNSSSSANSVTKIDSSTDTVEATISVGTSPMGIAVDGFGYVWVANSGSNNVSKIDPSTNAVVATVTVNTHPIGVAVDALGYVWVVNQYSSKVSKIDPSTNTVTTTVNVGSSPFALGDFTGFAYQHFVLGYSLPHVSPAITLSAAGSVTDTTATLNGNVTSDGHDTDNVDVTVYWGETDGGTIPASWDHSSNLGLQGIAAFTKEITGLNPETTYYFSASATNSAGTSWPAASLDFTTDLPALTGSPAFTAGTPATFGTEITVGAGTLSSSTSLTYTWYRSTDNAFDGGDTNLGTGTTYTPVAGDIGKYLIVVAAASDTSGTQTVVTADKVKNSGDSASVSTEGGSAAISAPAGFSSENLTLHIGKISISSAPAAPSGSILIGDNYFTLTATNDSDDEVDTFDKPVILTITYGSDLGSQYVESTLDVYKNNNGTWEAKNCQLDTSAKTLTCSLTSFSEYAVLGELADTDNDDNDDSGAESAQKARINSWKAEKYTTESSCREKLKLTIKGRHFAKGAEVRIGGKKAGNVERKNSREIVARFCLKDLLSTKTKLDRKVHVINPDADDETAKKRIQLGDYKPDAMGFGATNSAQNSANEAAASNTRPIPAYSGDARPNACSYTVEPGDNLWIIAGKIYGDAAAWPKIIENNRERFPNIVEKKLRVGWELVFDCER